MRTLTFRAEFGQHHSCQASAHESTTWMMETFKEIWGNNKSMRLPERSRATFGAVSRGGTARFDDRFLRDVGNDKPSLGWDIAWDGGL